MGLRGSRVNQLRMESNCHCQWKAVRGEWVDDEIGEMGRLTGVESNAMGRMAV